MFTNAQERKHTTRRGASFNQDEVRLIRKALRSYTTGQGESGVHLRVIQKFNRMHASFNE